MRRNNSKLTEEMTFSRRCENYDDAIAFIDFMKSCSYKYGCFCLGYQKSIFVISSLNNSYLYKEENKSTLSKDFKTHKEFYSFCKDVLTELYNSTDIKNLHIDLDFYKGSASYLIFYDKYSEPDKSYMTRLITHFNCVGM